MKTVTTTVLQILLVILAVGTAVFLLWFPNVEGRNVNSTLFEVYFKDPFLAYAYLVSILYFTGVYKVFTVLGLVRAGKAFSFETADSLRIVKRYAFAFAACVVTGMSIQATLVRGTEDIAGGVAMAIFLSIVSITVGFVASRFERAVRGTIGA